MSDTNKIRSLTTRGNPGIWVRRVHRKALSSKSFKRSECKSVMFTDIKDELRQLRALRVNITKGLVCEMAVHLVDVPDVDVTADQFENLTGRNLVM